MNRSIFICPVCGSPLSREAKSFICAGSHTYDISKEGYVNLLLANQKQSREPGDSKEMLDARKFFLNKGYYKPLARAVASAIIKYRKRSFIASLHGKTTYCQRRALTGFFNEHFSTPADSVQVRPQVRTIPGSGSIPNTEPVPVTEAVPFTEPVEVPDFTILDAGCGEGYYTDYISKNRYVNNASVIYGIDISRDGIKSAAKRSSKVNFAVAGIYNLPVLDNSVDLILNIFAPFNEAEFGRVLKNKGIIISVTPGAHHLYELKKNLYDDVYLNDEKSDLSDKFHITETVRVKYDLSIHNNEDVTNLLKMTPYYHKSSPERIESFLSTVHELKTTADFIVRIISKNTLQNIH